MTQAAKIFNTVHENDALGFWQGGLFEPKKVTDFLDLNKKEVAKLTGINELSVRYDNRAPDQVLEHLKQIANICTIVAEVFSGDREKTVLWFKTPNPMLGDITPRQMLRLARYDKLLKFILSAKEESQRSSEQKEQKISES